MLEELAWAPQLPALAYLLGRDDVREATTSLAREFSSSDRIGPRSYAGFMAAEAASADDRARLARIAVGAVGEFLEILL